MSYRTLFAVVGLAAVAGGVGVYLHHREQEAKARSGDLPTFEDLTRNVPGEPSGPSQDGPVRQGTRSGGAGGGGPASGTGEKEKIARELIPITLAQENELGPRVHAQVRQHLKLVDDPVGRARMVAAGTPMVARCRRGIGYSYFVIDSPEVNAFSHVGGSIYVNKGLLRFAMSSAELQFVLAHEIAHVELGHTTKKLAAVETGKRITGAFGEELATRCYDLIAAGHDKDQEFAADLWAYGAMREIGVPHEEILSFVRRFGTYLETPVSRDPIGDPGLVDSVTEKIQQHFRTLPSIQARTTRLDSQQR